jgi:RNA:NAD 2'-phosphotransferase (TPT1/KptA family)
MGVTPEEVLKNVDDDQAGPATKKRFEFLHRQLAHDLRDVHIRAGQGHNKRAQAMIDLDQLHEHMVPSHPKFQKWVMHGTKRENAQNIRRQGLYNHNRRADIHCVGRLDDHGDQAGLRGGTDTIVPVNTEALIALGGSWRYSRQGVWLTEGVDDGYGGHHVPPSCIGIIIDRVTGECACDDDKHQQPATDEQGMPNDGEYELEHEFQLGSEATKSLLGNIDFSLEEVPIDLTGDDRDEEMPSASGSSLAGPAGEFLHPGSAAVPRAPEAKRMPKKKAETPVPSSSSTAPAPEADPAPTWENALVFLSEEKKANPEMYYPWKPIEHYIGTPRIPATEPAAEDTVMSTAAAESPAIEPAAEDTVMSPAAAESSDYCSDIATEPSDDESVHASATPIVLPAMSGLELVGTLKGMQATDDALYDPVTFHNQVTSCTVGPSVDMLECQDFDKEEIRKAMLTARVSYAGGESDDDSIRDQEDGPHRCLQWHRRKPYFFRREPHLNDVRYRRRMQVNNWLRSWQNN